MFKRLRKRRIKKELSYIPFEEKPFIKNEVNQLVGNSIKHAPKTSECERHFIY